MAIPAVVVVELLRSTGLLLRLCGGLVPGCVVMAMLVMPHVPGFSLRLVLAVHEDRGERRLQGEESDEEDEYPGAHGMPTDEISAPKYR